MENSVVPQWMLCLLIQCEVYHALDLTEDYRVTLRGIYLSMTMDGTTNGLDGAIFCQYFLVLLTGGKTTGT